MTDIRKESNLSMPVISPEELDTGEAMTAEQFEREMRYQTALAVGRSMLKSGVINEADFLRIEAKLKEKFQPFFGGFLV